MDEQDRIEQEFRRAHLALAVEYIASLWHSGGASKGYAKGGQASRVLRKLGYRAGVGRRYDPEVRSIAAAYLWKHRRTIVREW